MPETSEMFSLDEALTAIAQSNDFGSEKQQIMMAATKKAIAQIPANVVNGCSARLLKDGRYLSINAGNHLIVRVPFYTDSGKRTPYDALLVWPAGSLPSILSAQELPARKKFSFQLFSGVNLMLSFAEILALTPVDWQMFQKGCHDAMFLRKTRTWPSNVRLLSDGVSA